MFVRMVRDMKERLQLLNKMLEFSLTDWNTEIFKKLKKTKLVWAG